MRDSAFKTGRSVRGRYFGRHLCGVAKDLDFREEKMRKLLSIIAGIVCLVGACANNENSTSLASNERPSMTAEAASKLAQRHLSLKNWSWGEPKEVVEREGKFYLSYETPPTELRIIGARVLIVDKDSKVVSVQKRR